MLDHVGIEVRAIDPIPAFYEAALALIGVGASFPTPTMALRSGAGARVRRAKLEDRGKRARKVAALVLSLCAALSFAAAPSWSRGGHAVTVASGTFSDVAWAFAVAGEGGKRCLSLAVEAADVLTGSVCEPDEPLRRVWVPGLGDSTAGDAATVRADLVQQRVARLRLLLGHPGPHRRPSNWTDIRPRNLTDRQVREAGLQHRFGYVVLTGIGNLCVEGLRAFDAGGKLIARSSLPCEY